MNADMRRREFVTLLGGAAAAWPLAARAQQAMPLVVFLRSAPLSDAAHLVMAFRQGLTEAGFVEGKNVAVEYHSAENDHDRLTALVADLTRRPVAVIVANVIAAVAAKVATTTVPIVFTTGSDPVQDGLVTSFNRPGGNVTGVSFFAAVLGAKRLELLRQLAPTATTIAVLVGPDSSDTLAERRDVEAAAQVLGQNIVVLTVTSDRDLETAFATLIQRGAGALLAGTGAFMYSQRERLAALAARHAIPAIYATRDFAAAGGLMSYAGSITDAYRQAGIYAGRILKGERPGDLPVMQSTKFELVINFKTAKALGLTIPQTLLVAADEVIE
jgi:putative tryptophan/tyrosine transport system substrate-binding protein